MRPFLATLLLAACSSPRAVKPAETRDAIAQPAAAQPAPAPAAPRTGGVGAQRAVPPFHAVASGGIFDVTITVGPAQDVVVTADPEVIPQVTTEVHDGWLRLDWNGHHMQDIGTIRIAISVPQLDAVRLTGVGELTATNIRAKTFSLDLSGAGDARLTGQVDTLDVDLSGAGKVDADGLSVRRADLDVSGSGTLDLNVVDSLSGHVSGAAHVRYRGTPSIDIEHSGVAEIEQK